VLNIYICIASFDQMEIFKGKVAFNIT